MSDFHRRERNLNYNDFECKRYLRNDFEKKCAYCGAREGDLGGEDSFQIDHFIPTSKGGGNDYNNLFYCCKDCNGSSGKSDYTSATLLNPCKDDIFVNNRIFTDTSFMFLSNDNRGKEFIEAIKLNRINYIKRRRDINQYRIEAEESMRKLETLLLEAQGKNDKNDIDFYKKYISNCKQIIENGHSYLGIINPNDEKESKFENILTGFCKYEKVNSDYNIDYIIKNNGKQVLIHLSGDDIEFGNNDNIIKLAKNEDIEKWLTLSYKVKIVYYDKNTDCFYYADVENISGLHRSRVNVYKKNILGIDIFD